MLYTSVQQCGKYLYYRGYRDDGTREQYIVGAKDDPYPDLVGNYYHFRKSDRGAMHEPYQKLLTMKNAKDFRHRLLYQPSAKFTDFKTLDDEEVVELDFDYRDTYLVKNLLTTEYPKIKIFSDIDFKYKYIRARNAVDTLKHTVKIAYIDIETETDRKSVV